MSQIETQPMTLKKKLKVIRVNFDIEQFTDFYQELEEYNLADKASIESFIADQFQGAAQKFDVRFENNMIFLTWGMPKEHTPADDHNKRALSFARNNQASEAIREWQKAIEINPLDPDFHYNLGLALFQKNNVKEGIHHCQQTLQICPIYYKAYFVLGSSYSKIRKYTEAEEYLRKGLIFDPDNVMALVNLGAIYSINKNNQNAIATFERAIQRSPKEIKAYFGLGRVYANERDYENANRCFNAVIKIDPEGKLGLLAKRSLHKSSSNEPKQAQTTQINKQQVIQEHKDVNNLMVEGYEYYLNGEYDKAHNFYSQYLEYKSDDADVWSSSGACLFRLDQVEKAINMVRKAIEINPGKPYFYKQLAIYYNTNNEPNKAGEAAHKAFTLGKRDSVVLSILGIAKAEQKQSQEAIRFLQEAVNADGNNLKARFHLAKVLKSIGQVETANQQFEEIMWSKVNTHLKNEAENEMHIS